MVAVHAVAVVETVEPMTFAEFLRGLMHDRAITASQVAAYAGVGRTTVTYWLRGVSTPERESVDKFSEALGLDRDLVRDIVEGRPVDAAAVTAASHTLYVTDARMVPVLQRIQRWGLERAQQVERLLIEIHGREMQGFLDAADALPDDDPAPGPSLGGLQGAGC